jgi:hypothetical protein
MGQGGPNGAYRRAEFRLGRAKKPSLRGGDSGKAILGTSQIGHGKNGMHESPEPPSARATRPLAQRLLALDRVAGGGAGRHVGDALHEEGRLGPALKAIPALSLPRVMFTNRFYRSSGIVLLEQLLLPEARGMLLLQ